MTQINYYSVTTETGGGKVPIRKRHNQNFNIVTIAYSEEQLINAGRKWLLDYLKFKTNGKVNGTKLTKIIIKDIVIK